MGNTLLERIERLERRPQIISVGTNGDVWKNFVKYRNHRWEGDFLQPMPLTSRFVFLGVYTLETTGVRLYESDTQVVAIPPVGYTVTGLSSVGIQSKGTAVGIGGSAPASFFPFVSGVYTDSCRLNATAVQATNGSWGMVDSIIRGHAYGTWD